MQVFLAEKTRQERLQEKLQKKRNLFGLGLTSLIAACGTDKAAGDDTQKMPDDNDNEMPDDNDNEMPGNGIDTYTPTVDLPDEVVKAEDLTGTGDGKSGFTAITDGGDARFIVAIGGARTATLHFDDGSHNNNNKVKIYKLTATDTQYDLVLSSFTMESAYDSGAEYHKGRVFIFWNVAGIEEETIGNASDTRTNQRLEIKGAAKEDSIGLFAPDFLQIGGTVNNYDIVFAGRGADRAIDAVNAGAIYVLWDIADYAGATKTIDLGKLDEVDPLTGDLGLGATSGSLTIYGAKAADNIGIDAPKLLELGSADDAYDMIIRSHIANKTETGEGDIKNEGAIYVLWDVTGYYNTEALHKTVTLDNSLVDVSGAYTNGATYGLLAIYGAKSGDNIGNHASEFLQLGGVADDKVDMVIRSHAVDKPVAGGNDLTNTGAIYALWDVADYAGKNKVIDLDPAKLAEADTATFFGEGATSGSLTIYGANADDAIGKDAPEFLQLAGDNQKQDMIIKAPNVDFDDNAKNVGAIYIFWDVADHNSATNPAAKVIHLGAKSGEDNYAEFGLLSIYGAHANQDADAATNQALGFGARNIIYKVDGDNKTLGDIDNDGIKDIVLKDDIRGAYILFGDQVLSPGAGGKIVSKTINLAKVTEGIGELNSGFFSYDFNTHVAASSSKDAEDRVGYRLNGEYLNFSNVKSAYEAANPLSDTDADLGVWDIA